MRKLFILLILFTITLPLWGQSSFERLFTSVENQLERGQYEEAKKTIESALNLNNFTPEQKSRLEALLNRCKQKMADRNRLDFGKNEVIVGYASIRDSVTIDAGQTKLTVSSSVTWCTAEINKGYLIYQVEMNENKEPREANITVRMGKKSKVLHLLQNARPETTKLVTIRTVPDRARISVDGSPSMTGKWENVLSSGEHSIHIEKSDYSSKDTTITVLDDMRSDSLKLTIGLVPLFAKLKLLVRPQPPFEFSDGPSYRVNGNEVDFSKKDRYSYDDEHEVHRFCEYNDNTIPISSGEVRLEISSTSFEPIQRKLLLQPGEVYEEEIELKAITGLLSLENTFNADSAKVFFDGRELGYVEDILQVVCPEGQHKVTLEKVGYKSSEPSYSVSIRENELTVLQVSMERYVPYMFRSSPSGALVHIDDNAIGRTPIKYELQETVTDRPYVVTYEQKGYLRVKHYIKPDYSSMAMQIDSAALMEASPFKMEVDENDLWLTVSDKSGKIKYVDNERLTDEFVLPVRKEPYVFELRRDETQRGKKYQAYKGFLAFNNKDKNIRKVRTWAKDNTRFLGIEYYLLPVKETSMEQYRMGKAYLASIPFYIPGLSTSAIRGTLMTDLGFKAVNAAAFSFILLNWDFRFGGSIGRFFDFNGLLSYAWYPPVWDLEAFRTAFGFHHYVGHDVFMGMEFSTRTVVNAGVKIGVQMYPGMQLYTYHQAKADSYHSNAYYSIQPSNLNPQFVVSVFVSVGTSRGAKGNNILRLFGL